MPESNAELGSNPILSIGLTLHMSQGGSHHCIFVVICLTLHMSQSLSLSLSLALLLELIHPPPSSLSLSLRQSLKSQEPKPDYTLVGAMAGTIVSLW